jgi:hypothetical protein
MFYRGYEAEGARWLDHVADSTPYMCKPIPAMWPSKCNVPNIFAVCTNSNIVFSRICCVGENHWHQKFKTVCLQGWGRFDKARVIDILTFYYQLQLCCVHKHLYIVIWYSWLTSNASSATFFFPLLINVMDIADWCIDPLVRFVLSQVELLSTDPLTANFLAPLIAAQGHLGAAISSSAISKCDMWSKAIQPSISSLTIMYKRRCRWAC